MNVLGMLSAEGLITMERLTLDGTKIKANASGNTFRRKDKLEAHLALAREQVEAMNAQLCRKKRRRVAMPPRSGVRRGSGRAGWKLPCVRLSVCSNPKRLIETNMSPEPPPPIRRPT